MTRLTRRRFLTAATLSVGAGIVCRTGPAWAQAAAVPGAVDARVASIVAKTIGIDTHNHVDVPLTAGEMPGPDLDLRGELKRSGLSAICMTFATDYQPGDSYDRFLKGFAEMDRQLEKNAMKRSLTAAEIRSAHAREEPTVIQAIEGAHFLEGKIQRVAEAYGRGLRHFGLLHDSDASVPLGDVYTNRSQFGGLTPFGTAVIKECNRLGMLVDLAHADVQTTGMALKTSTRPLLISHTGLDTQLGTDSRMATMMRPRLISKEQAKAVASAGGAVGVWTHLAETPLAFAANIRALVEVIGIDHVCIGTDTKLTAPLPFAHAPRSGGGPPPGPPQGGGPEGGPPPEDHGQGPRRQRAGERTNEAWADEKAGFYYTVVDALLKTGFSPEEIGKVGGENYLRIFAASTGK